MTDSANEVVRFEYYGPVPGFPLLVDRDNRKTATNAAERRRLEAGGYQRPSPGWPPMGWVTGYRPRNNSTEAICQWLDCQSKGLCLLEQWQDAGDPALNSKDVNGNQQDATDIVCDAYLLVKVLKRKGWRASPAEPRGRVSFRDARIELDQLIEWVNDNNKAAGVNSETDRKASLASAPTDDTAFVPAKTLREHRGMTAGKCNKFLTKYGTKSDFPVAGKVRYRKPDKKKLDIHSGDWHKFWEDVDRRQSEALDDDAMQEFLANAEAEKAKVKSARKLGRASSRQVS